MTAEDLAKYYQMVQAAQEYYETYETVYEVKENLEFAVDALLWLTD